MDASLLWLLVGIGLMIAEVATGTFYLLFLGVAALVGAVIAYFGFAVGMQSLGASAVAVVGVLWAQYHNRTRQGPPMPSIDLNQPVIWEGWIDRNAAVGRVKYRGASWDAHVHATEGAEVGEVFYIVSVEGSTLHISKHKTAAGGDLT
ncbi:MAG TPA: NfeD family protein [Burkholderiales bacterium]|nr:NfeD family protein [Burkholderiales bacterium]